ncbi:MAG: hypothetical protein SVU32_07980, partial [Candidatus Nanohaloarchaea archaeon]|nr:hypothetical protein [Candidatus Nanohaloarchaea archaeon]
GATRQDRHYAVVGCGDDKAGEMVAARELYTSNYFQKKREYAEEVCDGWAILSAKHGIVDPDEELEPYDVTAEDVDPDDYVERVADEIAEYAGQRWEPDGTVWILVGQPYLSLEDGSGRAIRDVLSEEVELEVRFPFRQTSGIGKQMGWLSSCVERGRAAMPYEMGDPGQQTLDQY